MDYGLIGNCQYNALIDIYGNVNWLCWPRFDSSFVFGGLLDKEQGGCYQISPPDGTTPGVQAYLPNTNILRTVFDTGEGQFEVIDFAPRFFLYERYYKPTMFIRIVRPISGEPRMQVKLRPMYNYGKTFCRRVFGSNHISYEGADEHLRLSTNASLNFINEEKPFIVDRTYYFVLTYGAPLETNLEHVCEEFLEKTTNYWRNWVKHCHLPRNYQKQVVRSALVLKLHQFEDTGAIIAASTTSIPEAPGTQRNWDYRYCWLRDALFSLMALQRLGHFDELEKFVFYLRNIVANMSAEENRLQPVYGISGEKVLTEIQLDHLKGYKGNKPVRIGNQAYEHLQHDVYGEMILAISQLFIDLRFYQPEQSKPFNLLTKLLDKVEYYLEAKDAGLWEFRGLAQLHTFTLLLHWAGATMAEEIAIKCGYQKIRPQAVKLKTKAAQLIFNSCYDQNFKAFTQAAGVPHLDASLLLMVNLGFLHPNDKRAHSHVDAIANTLRTENGFIHRYKHFDDFGETTNAFTICSFWLAEAYARLGRRAEAETLLNSLLDCSNHLGLYSEDIDPRTGELWGNFPQTYSHVGLINAVFCLSRDLDGPVYFEAAEPITTP